MEKMGGRQKRKNIDDEKSFLDEMKSIFHIKGYHLMNKRKVTDTSIN